MEKIIPFTDDSEIEGHKNANPDLVLRKVSRREGGDFLVFSDTPIPLSTAEILKDLQARVEVLEGV